MYIFEGEIPFLKVTAFSEISQKMTASPSMKQATVQTVIGNSTPTISLSTKQATNN
jgi:hypothetical protein